MNLQDLIEQAKTMPEEEFKEKMRQMIGALSPEERRDLAKQMCGAVETMARQFVPAVIDHIVETGHPFGQQAQTQAQDVLKQFTRPK